jgi:hypothetical protein
MAFTASGLIIDEASVDADSDLVPDNNVASLSAGIQAAIASATSGLIFYTPPTGFPQYAEQAGFVTDAPAGVTAYSLTDTSGNLLATSGSGIDSGLSANVNGTATEIYLYGTSNPDIIIGRLGGDGGNVALVIAVDASTLGSPNLWVSLYAPLIHSGPDTIDDGDVLNLSGLIDLKAAFDTTAQHVFPDFSQVASGQDAFAMIGSANDVDLLVTGFTYSPSAVGTVNVSTTGLGEGPQAVKPGAALRLDFVTATSSDFAKEAGTGVHDATNISYQGHVDADAASFKLTQVNPTGQTATVRIYAYQDSADLKGTAFPSGVLSNEGSQVAIESVKILNASNQDVTTAFQTAGYITTDASGFVTVTNLLVNYHVEVMTDSTHLFDRVLVENAGSGNHTFDIGDINVTTVTGGTGTTTVPLGNIGFEDGGPSISASAASDGLIAVSESHLNTPVSALLAGLFAYDYGPDGAGTVSYKLGVSAPGADCGLVDTLTGADVLLNYDSGTGVVTGSVNSGATPVFTISVDADGNVSLDQIRAVVQSSGDNPDTGESTGLSLASLITLTATVSDSETHADTASATASIGNVFAFEDTGPSMTGQALAADDKVTVANTVGSHDTNSFTLTPGPDGTSTATGLGYTIVGLPDTAGAWTWAYSDSTHTSIIESYTNPSTHQTSPIFSLTLDSSTGNYTMTMLGQMPFSQVNLDVNNIKAGGPTGSIDVGTINNGGEYVEISGLTNTTFNGITHTLTGTNGSVNASNGNVGVNNGNLDSGEVLGFQLFTSGKAMVPFYGLDMGTKTAASSSYELYGLLDFDHTTIVDLGPAGPYAKGGVIHYAGNQLLDEIFVKETSGNAVKIGLAGIHLLTPPDDAGFLFTAQLTDGDGDYTTKAFNAYIDGNGGGVDYAHVVFPI